MGVGSSIKICTLCETNQHLQCKGDGCGCVVILHHAPPRPGDKLRRLGDRVLGCAYLVPHDPGLAKEWLIEIARLIHGVDDNVRASAKALTDSLLVEQDGA